MALDLEVFQREVKEWSDRMRLTFALNRGVAYDGKIAGVDCIVFGFTQDPDTPTASIKPLAILITKEVFEALEVDGTKVSGT